MYLPRMVVPPPHSMAVTGRCNLYKKVWRETLKLFAWHLTALQAMPIDWTSPPKCNLPLDWYPVGSKEELACFEALEHYPKNRLSGGAATGDLRRPLVNVLPCAEERHRQNARLCRSLQAQQLHSVRAFQNGGLHTIPQLICRNDLITKVDLSDFYMHFLIGHADRRYMRFMWEGKKYQCIGTPFGLAPALRLATKMMAPVNRYFDRAVFE